MKLHELKIKHEYIDRVFTELKKAELRYNDRDFQVGDLITFVNEDGTPISGIKFNYSCQNLFINTDVCEYKDALKDNYVMLSIEKRIITTIEYLDELRRKACM